MFQTSFSQRTPVRSAQASQGMPARLKVAASRSVACSLSDHSGCRGAGRCGLLQRGARSSLCRFRGLRLGTQRYQRGVARQGLIEDKDIRPFDTGARESCPFLEYVSHVGPPETDPCIKNCFGDLTFQAVLFDHFGHDILDPVKVELE